LGKVGFGGMKSAADPVESGGFERELMRSRYRVGFGFDVAPVTSALEFGCV
jgi:hypothetical protein